MVGLCFLRFWPRLQLPQHIFLGRQIHQRTWSEWERQRVSVKSWSPCFLFSQKETAWDAWGLLMQFVVISKLCKASCLGSYGGVCHFKSLELKIHPHPHPPKTKLLAMQGVLADTGCCLWLYLHAERASVACIFCNKELLGRLCGSLELQIQRSRRVILMSCGSECVLREEDSVGCISMDKCWEMDVLKLGNFFVLRHPSIRKISKYWGFAIQGFQQQEYMHD